MVVSDVEVDGEYQFERVRYSSSPEHLLAEWLIAQQVEEVGDGINRTILETGLGCARTVLETKLPGAGRGRPAANEYGAAASAKLFGVEILNEGFGSSVDDSVLEMQATFVARSRRFFTSNLSGNTAVQTWDCAREWQCSTCQKHCRLGCRTAAKQRAFTQLARKSHWQAAATGPAVGAGSL